MNLKDHKTLLRDYESVLRELQELVRAKELRVVGWELTCSIVDTTLSVSDEFAAKVLQDRMWVLEADAKARAQALGVEA